MVVPAGFTVVVVDAGAAVAPGVAVVVAGCTVVEEVVVFSLVTVAGCVVVAVAGCDALPGWLAVAGCVVTVDAGCVVVVVEIVVLLAGCCAKATNPVSISALKNNFFISLFQCI